MVLLDEQQRKEATNPLSSFIVQAPAGSGKTEILTQRYLRLLGRVTAPEQIIALTFTRKAASEMRERIVLALQQAANNTPAHSPHQQTTLDFARAALNCSKAHHWNLLEQPNRLKIITIDSLCQSINQAIPLLEKQISYSQITDKAETYYRKAASNCIQFALETPHYQQAIKILLLHVDNNQNRLIQLFNALLAQRDQWITYLFHARDQDKSSFENALEYIEQHELNKFKQCLNPVLAYNLTSLARELACIENNTESPRFLLKDWHDFKECTPEIAKALTYLVLGSDKQIRKSFDHHVGLRKTECSKEEFQRIKNTSIQLLEELREHPNFLDSLLQVSQLPQPRYEEEQWEVLQALFVLLPLLLGHLHLLFSTNNEVDFTAISQQALNALGESDTPTDLALYLDNAVHHLLIDEFQDTSISQFELINKLVQGWQEGDGKTLFLVGDPMQSIYRFRQAEVGLFFKAKEYGIGPVRLNSLELSCNFRSSETIVSWINQHFSKIFPPQVDIESGAVSFHASVHVHKDDELSAIQAFKCRDKEQEARQLIEVIKQELQANSKQSIAILVRSRSQLSAIISLLRQHQIPYQGTDITLLANLPHIRDVWSLTQALLNPGNRLSWLSLLRSPYCGLSLADINLIAQLDTKKSIYNALLQLDSIDTLSDEGRLRALFFIEIMHQALLQRYQTQLSDWIGATLKQLHAETILTSEELADLEQFWSLLDRFEEAGRLPEGSEFRSELKKLYSQQSSPSQLQIMTIHKSKGLEFDTVILPSLGSKPSHSEEPLLRWLQLPTTNQGNLLLVSPIRAAHHNECPLYDYLSLLDAEKSQYEAQRVLYVAATRAKSRLYLFDNSAKSYKGSFRQLLQHQEFIEEKPLQSEETMPLTLPELKKLPLEFYEHPRASIKMSLNPIITGIKTGMPRLIGIITHKLLQWICDYHPSSLEEIPWNLALYELNKLGLEKLAKEQALQSIQNQITLMFNDKIGRWILEKQDKEQNEYQLLVEKNKILITRIVDRVFEYQSQFWIIDFKTGKEDQASLNEHQKQLNEYATYLSNHTTLPIHCGLYYLINTHWVHWQSESISEACVSQ